MKITELQPGFSYNHPFPYRTWMTRSGAAAPAQKPPIELAPEKRKGLKRIIAGGITGAVQCCISYPADFVKTHLQLDETCKKHYDGIIDCIGKTIRQDGFFGLYRGLSPVLLGSIPKSSIRFGSFEIFKYHMMDEMGIMRPLDSALCGLGAGVLEAIIAVTPIETIKVKLIHDKRMQKPTYKGLVHGVTTIVRDEGLRGLYQGVTATVLTQGSNMAIRVFVMETLKNWYRNGDNSVRVPKHVIGAFGAIAGAISVFGNASMDVVKTRMQGRDAKRYDNTLHCIAHILEHEGVLAFYKGTIPRLIRVCIDVAISFVILESLMDLLHRFFPN